MVRGRIEQNKKRTRGIREASTSALMMSTGILSRAAEGVCADVSEVVY